MSSTTDRVAANGSEGKKTRGLKFLGPINNRKDVFLRRKTSFFEESCLSAKKDVFLRRKTSFFEEVLCILHNYYVNQLKQ